MSRSRKVCLAPLALTSDGTLVLNAAHTDGGREPAKLVERAVAAGGDVFVGVSLTPKEVAFVLRRADDALAELAALVLGARRHRRSKARAAAKEGRRGSR